MVGLQVFAEGEWTIPLKNICLNDRIYDGPGGTIYKSEVFGLAGGTGWSTVSVKMLQGTASDNQKSMFLREVEAMKTLKPNANVLQLLGCCLDKDNVFMIVESVPFGTLQEHLWDLRNATGHNSCTLTRDLVSFGAQVARGMAYLSTMKILHRNLCAANVLLGDGRLCKVSSFGFIQDVIENHEYERATELPLPIRWMAPESLLSNIFTSKSDVFSLGVLLWEIITLGATPYQGMSTEQVTKALGNGHRMPRPPHCHPDLYLPVVSCWHVKPPERPTFQQTATALQDLHDQNRDLVKLDEDIETSFFIMDNADFPGEIL